jgi:AraC family transcriptional regulator
MYEPDPILCLTPAPTPPLLISLIEQAAFLFEGDNPAARQCLQKAVLLLRARLPREATPKARESLATWQVRKLMGHIDTSLSGAIRIRDLGELLNLSSSHFTRAFKSSVGISPYQFVIRRRIERAQELMRGSQHSLAQIALDCGLNDQSSLCRLFRQLVGQTPARWRRQNAALCEAPHSLDDTMSRRPKRLGSTENVPGPKIPSLTVIRTATAVLSGPTSDVCVPSSVIAQARHARGVSAPSASSKTRPAAQHINQVDN